MEMKYILSDMKEIVQYLEEIPQIEQGELLLYQLALHIFKNEFYMRNKKYFFIVGFSNYVPYFTYPIHDFFKNIYCDFDDYLDNIFYYQCVKQCFPSIHSIITNHIHKVESLELTNHYIPNNTLHYNVLSEYYTFIDSITNDANLK
jgi:hypothetical protein